MTKPFVEMNFLSDNFSQTVDNETLSPAERVERASHLARAAVMLSNGGGSVGDRSYDHVTTAAKRNPKP